MSELQGITCHAGSHSVTCQPTQLNTLCLNLYNLPRTDGRLSDLGGWLCTGKGFPVYSK